MKSRFPWFPILLVLLCASGVALELYTTRLGPVVRGDSVRYVMGARNILAGNGFSRLSGGWEVFPETGFAPLLSFVLAGLGVLGVDMYAGARILNAFLFGGSLFLVGTMVAMAARSKWVGLLACLFVLLAPNVVEWHAWLMSEALFIFLMLLGVYSLVVHIQTGRSGPLYLSAVAVGVASLARYVGVSLVPAGGLAILLWGRGPARQRLSRALIYGAVAILPFALWMARNQVVGGAGLANREIRYHAFRPEMLKVLLFEPTSWVLPEAVILPRTVRGALALLALMAGPVFFLIELHRWRGRGRGAMREEQVVLPLLLLILIPAYVGILAVNSLLLDAGTTYSGILRYLTPLYILVVILELTAYARGLPPGRLGVPLAVLAVLAAAGLLASQAIETIGIARQPSDRLGTTFVRGEWTELIRQLSAQGPDEPILTDNPEMVYFLIDRPAYAMPIKYDPYRQAFREDFPQQIDLARRRLDDGAVLVVFGEPSEEEAEVIELLSARSVHRYEGAVVYSALR
jgi:4-amino-4-deoxy-L-arabinose transferase-like glycosyltransferase